MKPRLWIPILAVAALSAGLFTPGAQASGGKAFRTYASCGKSAPFRHAHHCRYDKGHYFRGTFVFRSTIGKRRVKACFKIHAAQPLGGAGTCAEVGPLSYKAYPFKITGVRQPFLVEFTWSVKKPGSKKPFKQVAKTFLRVRP